MFSFSFFEFHLFIYACADLSENTTIRLILYLTLLPWQQCSNLEKHGMANYRLWCLLEGDKVVFSVSILHTAFIHNLNKGNKRENGLRCHRLNLSDLILLKVRHQDLYVNISASNDLICRSM